MIREMTVKDIPTVLEIFNDIILTSTAVYLYEPQTLEYREQWFLTKKQNNEPMFVYEENGNVAGFATYGSFRPYPAFKYTVEHSVYVHKEYYQKGIGTKLMKHLIGEAERRGIKTMVACIDGENKGSIISHEKLGFYYAGTIKNAGYKFGRWLDLIFYQLDLKGKEHLI